jgi:hypothetical protein
MPNPQAPVTGRFTSFFGINPKTLLTFSFLVTLFVSLFSSLVLAAPQTWSSTGDNKWSDSANWSEGTVPASGENVIFDGTSVSNCNMDLSGGTTILTLTITSGYTGTLQLSGGSMTVTGNFSIDGGTFSLSSKELILKSSFTHSGGVLNAQTSTVTFAGTGKTSLTGSTTFHIIRYITSGATMQIAAGTTQYVTLGVDFQNIALKSSTDNATWYFKYTGSSSTIKNVTVRDSNASISGGSTMVAGVSSDDLGNNTNWQFGGDIYWRRNTSGSTGNWSDGSNWSYTSGGSACNCLPAANDHVHFDGNGISGVVINQAVSVASITATSGYTGGGANDGHIDNATNDYAILVSANVTLDNKQVSMGDNTWTVGGNWDAQDVTTFSENISTITLTGVSKTFLGKTSGNIYSLIVNSGASVTLNNSVTFTRNVVVAGTITVAGGTNFGAGSDTADLQVTSSGVVGGAGQVYFGWGNSSISQMDGIISVSVLNMGSGHSGGAWNTFAPGRYDSPSVVFYNDWVASLTLQLLSGTYTFTGDVDFRDYTSPIVVDNSANNPNLVFRKNLTILNYGNGLIWTKGTGTITFATNTAQTAIFLGKSVENIISSNTSSNGLTFTSSFTAQSFTVNSSIHRTVLNRRLFRPYRNKPLSQRAIRPAFQCV